MSKNSHKILNEKDKYIFFLVLRHYAKAEKSTYAKLLFQENIIALSIIATLNAIALFFNHQTIKSIQERKSKRTTFERILQIEFSPRILERKTLGQLSMTLDPYLTLDKKLRLNLKKFINGRNNITHNMFLKYKNISDLDKDSQKLVQDGEKIIDELDTFRNELLSEIGFK